MKHKRLKQVLLIVFAAIVLAVAFTAWMLDRVDIGHLDPKIAQDSEGNCYVVKHDIFNRNIVLGFNRDGKIKGRYALSSEVRGNASIYRSIKDLYVNSKDELFMLIEDVDISSSIVTSYEVQRISRKLGDFSTPVTLYSEDGVNLDAVSDFVVEGDILYFGRLAQNDTIARFESFQLSPNDTTVFASDVKPLRTVQGGSGGSASFRNIVLAGNAMYALCDSGQIKRFGCYGDLDEIGKSNVRADCIFRDGERDGILVVDGNKITEIEEKDTYPCRGKNFNFSVNKGSATVIAASTSDWGDVYIVKADNGLTEINITNGNIAYEISTLGFTFTFVAMEIFLPLVVTLLLVFVGGLIYMSYIRKNGKNHLKRNYPYLGTVLASLAFVAIIGIVIIFLSASMTEDQLIEEHRAVGEAEHQTAIKALDGIELSLINLKTFDTSEECRTITAAFEQSGEIQSKYETINQLFFYDDGTFYNLISETGVVGKKTSATADEEMMEVLEETVEAGSTIYTSAEYSGIEYLLISSPIIGRFGKADGVIFTLVSLGDMQVEIRSMTIRTLLIFLAGFALLAVFLLIVTGRSFRPVKKLPGVILSVMEGRATENDLSMYDGVYLDIGKSLKEAGRVWLDRIHAQNLTVVSSSRFIPKKLNRLLNRESVKEIVSGDSAILNGYIAAISLYEKTPITDDLAGFVGKVNRTLRIFARCIDKFGGVPITRNSAMQENISVYGNAEDAVGFTDFVFDSLKTEYSEAEESSLPGILVVVHKTDFLYGVAGADTQLVPLMVSPEIDSLLYDSARFKSAGVRTIVTEEVYNEVRDFHKLRYIGFLKSHKDDKPFKIYEVLDSFKGNPYYDVMVRNAGKLEEAIGYFYKDDFYIARNLFSSIIAECPKDGIARWYLFACDKYFNNPTVREYEYALFSEIGNTAAAKNPDTTEI
ncbi:MAG: hypothetical protein K6F52_06845 [Clostridia bacterium]|nr:hypothetical protein [Clostridia bacterium]